MPDAGGGSPLGDCGELVAILARGYLRLTEQARNDGISDPNQPQKELDVDVEESPHDDDQVGRRRARCQPG